MSEEIPAYLVRQISRVHGPSLREWAWFRYPRFPSGFTIMFLVLSTGLVAYRYFITGNILWISVDILAVDAAIYGWFTTNRRTLALKRLARGEPWRIIRHEEVMLNPR